MKPISSLMIEMEVERLLGVPCRVKVARSIGEYSVDIQLHGPKVEFRCATYDLELLSVDSFTDRYLKPALTVLGYKYPAGFVDGGEWS